MGKQLLLDFRTPENKKQGALRRKVFGPNFGPQFMWRQQFTKHALMLFEICSSSIKNLGANLADLSLGVIYDMLFEMNNLQTQNSRGKVGNSSRGRGQRRRFTLKGRPPSSCDKDESYCTLWVLLLIMQMDVKSMVLGHILTLPYNLNVERSLLPNVAPKWTSTTLIEIFIP